MNMDNFKVDVASMPTTELAERVRRQYCASISFPYTRYGVDMGGDKPFDDNRQKPEDTLPEEEWIWVTGYKGTYQDMKCKNNYQFEVGKKFDMPEDAVISTCHSGFHFCPKLKDVFDYYAVGDGHRFFEVSALVRAKEYADHIVKHDIYTHYLIPSLRNNKLAAKSIIFTRELTIDEILTAEGVDFSDWTEEEKTMAIENCVDAVKHTRQAKQLVELGYSEAFAKWIVNRGDFDDAYAVGQQKDLSMDMKVAAILG